MAAGNIIIKPVLSEKSDMLVQKPEHKPLNKYSFVVDKKADKVQIKSAIEKMYGVTVTSVNTMNYGGGKAKMRYTTRGVAYSRNPAWKKAVVTVAEGDYIDLFAGV